MIRLECAISVALGVASLAHAGGALEVLPDVPGPYSTGQPVTVEVWLHNGEPVGHDIRLVQLDITTYDFELIVGGDFTEAGGVPAKRIARRVGIEWLPVGFGLTAPVHALSVYDDGQASLLYGGGEFTGAYTGIAGLGRQALYFARWEGTSHRASLTYLDGPVRALAVYDDGPGPGLYLGGDFTVAGYQALDTPHITRWDGVVWQPLSSGVDGGASPSVLALAVLDDGLEAVLYVGGLFTTAGGLGANNIAKWDGASWSSLGSGIDGPVYTLAVYDDGDGPALYAGGAFTAAGGVVVNNIAKWDGVSWSPLGDGTDGSVTALALFDDGNGPALYAGGAFTIAGGVGANSIAKWDGSSWSPLGSGTDGTVYTLGSYDDDGGRALYAGGTFSAAGGAATNNIARWSGTCWSAAGVGTNDAVRAMTVYDDGIPPDLSLDSAFEFDFSTLSDGGVVYLQVPGLPILGCLYISSSPQEGSILHLPAGGSLRIGSLGLVLPTEPGSYTLDVANPGQEYLHNGAKVAFGFGPSIDEPYTVWGATTGELSGGTYIFHVMDGSCGSCQLHADVFPVGGNCVVDIDDYLYIAAGFADPLPCVNFPGSDIAPCRARCNCDSDCPMNDTCDLSNACCSLVDIDDILSVLSAFGGIYVCPHPCPPGACCLTDGTCQDWDQIGAGTTPSGGMSQTTCAGLGGTFTGGSATCDDVEPCP